MKAAPGDDRVVIDAGGARHVEDTPEVPEGGSAAMAPGKGKKASSRPSFSEGGRQPEGAPSRLGIWSKKARTADQARPLRAAVRGLTFVASIELLIILVLGSAVAGLVPLRRDVPYIMESRRPGEQVLALQPLRISSRASEIMAERESMAYINIRFEIIPDRAEMARRWGTNCLGRDPDLSDRLCAYVHRRSTAEIYDSFREENFKQVEKLIAAHTTRRVDITADPIRKGENQWEIRFNLVDTQPGKDGEIIEVRRRHLVAMLWTRMFDPQEIPRAQRFLNPENFKIVQLSVSEIREKAKTLPVAVQEKAGSAAR